MALRRRASLLLISVLFSHGVGRRLESAEIRLPLGDYTNATWVGIDVTLETDYLLDNGPTPTVHDSLPLFGSSTAGSFFERQDDRLRFLSWSASDATERPLPGAQSVANFSGTTFIDPELGEQDDEPVIVAVRMAVKSNVPPVFDTITPINAAVGVGLDVYVHTTRIRSADLANSRTVLTPATTGQLISFGFGAASAATSETGQGPYAVAALLEIRLLPPGFEPQDPPDDDDLAPLPIAPIQVLPPRTPQNPTPRWVSQFTQVPTGKLITGIATWGAQYDVAGDAVATGIDHLPDGHGNDLTVHVDGVALPQVFHPGDSVEFSDFALVLGDALVPHNGALGVQSFVVAAAAAAPLSSTGFLDIGLSFSAPQASLTMTSLMYQADFDLDQDVDGADFLTWQRGMGTQGTAALTTGDANGDEKVDASDFAQWKSAFGTSSILAHAVPEHATIWMVGLAGWSLIRVRRQPRLD